MIDISSLHIFSVNIIKTKICFHFAPLNLFFISCDTEIPSSRLNIYQCLNCSSYSSTIKIKLLYIFRFLLLLYTIFMFTKIYFMLETKVLMQFLNIILAEYPWQVAILKKEEFDNVYVCGGSLIDGSHLLTAAHCIKGYKPHELR